MWFNEKTKQRFEAEIKEQRWWKDDLKFSHTLHLHDTTVDWQVRRERSHSSISSMPGQLQTGSGVYSTINVGAGLDECVLAFVNFLNVGSVMGW